MPKFIVHLSRGGRVKFSLGEKRKRAHERASQTLRRFGARGVHMGAVSLFIIRVLRAKKEEKTFRGKGERERKRLRMMYVFRWNEEASRKYRPLYASHVHSPPTFPSSPFCFVSVSITKIFIPLLFGRPRYAIGRNVKKETLSHVRGWWVSNGKEKNLLTRHSSRPIYRKFHLHHV